MRFFSLFLALLFAHASHANNFPAVVKTELGNLSRCSQTEVSVMKFISVADAALYSEDCSQLPALAEHLQLSFIYHREIAGEDFIEAAETLLRRNLTAEEYTQIETDLNAFNQSYQSVQDGDRYDVRRSKNGLFLLKNGHVISHHSSTVLGQVYYLIWFGDKPFNEKLKAALLRPEA